MRYTVILEPDPEGGYTVICPALPGCVSEGETVEEALAMIQDAILAWLAAAKEQRTSLQVETAELVAAEIAEVLRGRAEEGLELTIETRVVEATAPVRR